MEIDIPYKFEPRFYQVPLFKAIDQGIKRAFCFWHRRAGKDKTMINIVLKEAFQKVGIYYYFFPTYTQGKKVLWDNKEMMKHIPRKLIKKKNDSELKIEFINGSILQVIGTDRYDSVRGTNPIGCVFSEYAFQNPMAWDIVRPILAENGGWAIFNSTPNGENHAFEMKEMAMDNEKWFCQILTIEDTNAVPMQVIQDERDSGMGEEMIQQEYYCSTSVGQIGAIYGAEMKQVTESGRITELPFYIDKQIDIYFDLGISTGNQTAMWFRQSDGDWHNFINYFEAINKGDDYYCSYIDEYIKDKNGKLGTIYLPHDSKKRERTAMHTSIKNTLDYFRNHFGYGHVQVLPPNAPNDNAGFMSVRRVLPRCKFDKENCKQGIRALKAYKYEYDELKKVYRKTPCHDWASNGADSFRYFAISDSATDTFKTQVPTVRVNTNLFEEIV